MAAAAVPMPGIYSKGPLFILSETDVANPGIGFGMKTTASASPAIPLLLMQD